MRDPEAYLREGLKHLPHLLELQDRNRLSPSYGSFDRAYWHYRTSDFPSGMFQEGVLPLALAYTLNHPANSFFQKERLKELAWAGVDFARRSSHPDGSCDDYFPFERAAGAAAFSLYACTEASLLLDFKDAAFLDFFKKRGSYLYREGYEESGVLSNHKALIVLCLFNVFLCTGNPEFRKMAETRLTHLLSLQNAEGWFPEYEGCDPGYLNFTIDFLAKYRQKSKNEQVLEPLKKAVRFACHFVHPDGTCGGEYGSRNTFHFLPHGFELMAEKVPEAFPALDLFLGSLKREEHAALEDDRIFCHFVYNFLQAFTDFAPRTWGVKIAEPKMSLNFQEAGLIVRKEGNRSAVLSVRKGGAGKIYEGRRLVLSDAGITGTLEDGRKFTSQVVSPKHTGRWAEERLIVEGCCYLSSDIVFTPLSFWLFRSFLLFAGRFLPANTVRSLLQKRVILKSRKQVPIRFKKVFDFGTWRDLEISLFLDDPRIKVRELWLASDATFIYVAASQPFQPATLHPWKNLARMIPELNEKRTAAFRQTL